ncbi:VOC family protein [Nesterenkonia sp. PF2B19]|uniref:VOC family protein n=1 Tax=Nesterenkonia sp. PF2B19 TaxID=1881858 RepID=UPI000871D78F|nr:VOC family protein [Nesterenkonia sp. PF2B19]OSM42428.1 glyoxalase [Nesterenkonia sp. PF2B19]
MSIGGVGKVAIGVRDQQRALSFWVDVVGCQVAIDAPYGESGERWLEVTTPDGQTRLVLSLDPDGEHTQDAPEGLPTSEVFFYAEDLRATYEVLTARGVRFPTPPQEHPWGWWSLFEDTEGNRFALQQRG